MSVKDMLAEFKMEDKRNAASSRSSALSVDGEIGSATSKGTGGGEPAPPQKSKKGKKGKKDRRR